MAITPADVQARFPEFASLTTLYIQTFITVSQNQLSTIAFDVDFDEASLYFVAHMIQIAQDTQNGNPKASGMVTSMAIGDNSASFNSFTTDSTFVAFFMQTNYGMQFLQYIPAATAGGFYV